MARAQIAMALHCCTKSWAHLPAYPGAAAQDAGAYVEQSQLGVAHRYRIDARARTITVSTNHAAFRKHMAPLLRRARRHPLHESVVERPTGVQFGRLFHGRIECAK